MTIKRKKRVLFICTHNSARSQMAEGLLSTLYGDLYEAYSAGTIPTNVNPNAIEVMKEIGIDISNHRVKSIKEFMEMQFNFVITVCDNAKETCPFFPGGETYIHKSFSDPVEFSGEKLKTLEVFRKIRDEMKYWISDFFGKKDNDLFRSKKNEIKNLRVIE